MPATVQTPPLGALGSAEKTEDMIFSARALVSLYYIRLGFHKGFWPLNSASGPPG
jgi:hypothetical protein